MGKDKRICQPGDFSPGVFFTLLYRYNPAFIKTADKTVGYRYGLEQKSLGFSNEGLVGTNRGNRIAGHALHNQNPLVGNVSDNVQSVRHNFLQSIKKAASLWEACRFDMWLNLSPKTNLPAFRYSWRATTT